jgi:hypothetical protein
MATVARPQVKQLASVACLRFPDLPVQLYQSLLATPAQTVYWSPSATTSRMHYYIYALQDSRREGHMPVHE